MGADSEWPSCKISSPSQRTTSDRSIPFTLFIKPELACVGLTEKQVRQQGLEICVAKLPLAAIPRAKTISETRGFIKAVVDAKNRGSGLNYIQEMLEGRWPKHTTAKFNPPKPLTYSSKARTPLNSNIAAHHGFLNSPNILLFHACSI